MQLVFDPITPGADTEVRGAADRASPAHDG